MLHDEYRLLVHAPELDGLMGNPHMLCESIADVALELSRKFPGSRPTPPLHPRM